MRTPAEDDADYGDGAHLSVRVSVHLAERTTAEVTTYPDEDRATIALTGFRQSVGVILFGHTPQLRELRDLLTDTLAALPNTDPSPTAAADSDSNDATVHDRAA